MVKFCTDLLPIELLGSTEISWDNPSGVSSLFLLKLTFFWAPPPPIAKANHLFFHSELVSVAQSMVSMANPGSWLKFDTQNLPKKRPLKKNLRLLGGA
jgi:hypothetical protein